MNRKHRLAAGYTALGVMAGAMLSFEMGLIGESQELGGVLVLCALVGFAASLPDVWGGITDWYAKTEYPEEYEP